MNLALALLTALAAYPQGNFVCGRLVSMRSALSQDKPQTRPKISKNLMIDLQVGESSVRKYVLEHDLEIQIALNSMGRTL